MDKKEKEFQEEFLKAKHAGIDKTEEVFKEILEDISLDTGLLDILLIIGNNKKVLDSGEIYAYPLYNERLLPYMKKYGGYAVINEFVKVFTAKAKARKGEQA